MSFEAKDYPISDIINKVVFDIPRNQRRYVWKKSSWQDLFEDVQARRKRNGKIWKGSLGHPLISLYGTMQFIVMETYEINIIHHTKLFKKTVVENKLRICIMILS